MPRSALRNAVKNGKISLAKANIRRISIKFSVGCGTLDSIFAFQRDIFMTKRPRPYDPFVARMEAKRQAEWEARCASKPSNETSVRRPSAFLSWQGLAAGWKTLTTVALNLVAVLAFVAILTLLYKAVTERTVTIAPIPVPKELAEKGYTPETAAKRLQSALQDIIVSAASPTKAPSVAMQSDQPSIVVPSTGLSLETIAAYLRTFLGFNSRSTISGQIVSVQNKLWLRLQLNEQEIYASAAGVDPNQIDDLFAPAAEEMMEHIDPLTRAWSLADKEQKRSIELLNQILTQDKTAATKSNVLGFLCVISYNRLETEKAVDECIQAVDAAPRNTFNLRNLGQILSNENRLDEAEKQLKQAIANDPTYDDAHVAYANVLEKQHKLREATIEYNIAADGYRSKIRRNPADASAHWGLGYVMESQDKPDEAIKQYKMAIKLSPHDASLHRDLGLLFAKREQLKDAIKEYEEAAKLAPDNTDLGMSLIDVLYRDKQESVAKDEFGKIEETGRAVFAYSRLGEILYNHGKTDEAIAEYKKAIALASGSSAARAHNGLGVILVDRHKADEAIAEYEKAIELEPRNAIYHENLGHAFRDQHKTDEAIAEYKKAIALDPQSASHHNALGVILYNQDKTGEAIVEYKKAVELDPRNAMFHKNLGHAFKGEHKTDEAIAEYKKAVELDPKEGQFHNDLGGVLSDQGKTGEAIAEYKNAIALDPQNAAHHNALGVILHNQDKTGEAIAEYKKAIELDPRNAIFHKNLGHAFRDQHKTGEAIAEYRNAIALDPQNASHHNALGGILYNQHKTDEAIAEVKKAIELDPGVAIYHENLGDAFKDQHKIDEAIIEFRKAIELDPHGKNFLDNLDSAIEEQGKNEKAKTELNNAKSPKL